MPSPEFTPVLRISVSGIQVTDLENQIVRLEVHSSIGLPSMFHMIIGDFMDTTRKFKYLDSDLFKIGKKIEIKAGNASDLIRPTLIKGEITTIEPNFKPDGSILLHIRGFDDSCALSQGRKTKSYKKKTDSEIIRSIASENRIAVNVDTSSTRREQVIQLNQTDWEFIQLLAARNGMIVYFREGKLECKKIDRIFSSRIKMNWGGNLGSFRPRISALGQKSNFEATGWDVKTKAKIKSEEKSSSSARFHKIGETSSGGQANKKVTGVKTEDAALDVFSVSADDLKAYAAGAMTENEGNFIQAEGECVLGNPQLLAGTIVGIEDVGPTFSGDYFITEARHEFEEGQYHVSFSIHGVKPETLSSLLNQHLAANGGVINGVVPAIVTNNNDDKGGFQAGRVKVKYPWFNTSGSGAEIESDWARVAITGGGANRGMYFMPEINDEVLVAFEQGDINRPYILGGLWNGKDKPAAPINKIVSQGKVNMRMIRTRSGHEIQLDDTDGSEKITIVDKTGNNSITLDTKNNSITIKADKDLVLDAGGKMTLKCQGAFEVSANGAAKMESKQGIDIQATGAMKVGSKQSVAIQDSGTSKLNLGPGGAEVQGTRLSLKGTAMAEIQAALVKIN